MTWRMIFRRNPSRSMTIVGDLAQASSPWSPSSWGEVLDSYGADRWSEVQLTVNYRTPSEIMHLAVPVLAAASPGVVAPAAIRDAGSIPIAYLSDPNNLGVSIFRVVANELSTLEEGRLAVLVPSSILEPLRESLAQQLPLYFAGGNRADDARVVLLDTRDAKGLEFDVVIVVEPQLMIDASPRGMSDLYVALTRATQRLIFVHETPLPSLFPADRYEVRSLPGE